MAKFFFTSGRVRSDSKRKGDYDVKPIRPGYSEMGGGSGGTNDAYASGGSANGGMGFFGPKAQPSQSSASTQPKSSSGGYYAPKGENGGESGDAAPANGYDAGSFEDYYSRLISALHSYGIEMALPTLDELYNQLSAFLRPSVDAAIAGRQRYGETVMAELDADAYSRGMGASSYLSGMKNREYDDIANDIASMETSYNSTLAEYLYNASNELASIQAQFAAMNREHELEMQRQLQQQAYENERLRRQQEFEAEQERLRQAYEMERLRQQQEFERAMREAANASSGHGDSSGSGASGSGSSGGTSGHSGSGGSISVGKPGGSGGSASVTGSGSEANYYNYTVYLNTLSVSDRRKLFSSSSEYWTAIREELKRNLTNEQYERLRATFDPGASNGSGYGSGQVPGRNWNVNTAN